VLLCGVMATQLNEQKTIEKAYHDQMYDGEGALPAIGVEDFERTELQPCYTTGRDLYAENKKAFHKILHAHGGWRGKHVLDYACGFGDWACYFALTGARCVNGFDLSETAIRRGRQRVERQGLARQVQLDVMDATKLTYPDDSFEIVIGHGVIHHTIKYPGIFEQMHRVMKPGTKAYFLENLADFPLFRLYWWLKGEVPEGDVPVFSKELREKTSMFSDVQIIGDTFTHSIKTFMWKPNPSPARRRVMAATQRMDEALFRAVPSLRRWGSFCYIVLTK
jgi:ubiquinone/menaquinone biosynthesis C-methylase UbiE